VREYPKIETLFERSKETFIVDLERLKQPIFADFTHLVVTEKIDGMNIRVGFTKGQEIPNIAGRTDKAALPGGLLAHILAKLPMEKRDSLFNEGADPATTITLFGEGYGAGIQRGAALSATKKFILFDVLIEAGEGAWWMPDQTVTAFADRLGIPRVPIIGYSDLDEIVEMVKAGFQSHVAEAPCMAEGVVARPRHVLYDANKKRLILKLKTKDFHPGVKGD
jgi:hypothetical protein